MRKAHNAKYSLHARATKLYQDLKKMYWWPSMKKEICIILTACEVCQRVELKHQRLAGMLNPLTILKQKWENVATNFTMGLPVASNRHNSIWVIVDRLTKATHFIPVKANCFVDKLAQVYIVKIIQGALMIIVSNRGPQFTLRFWHYL